MPPKDNQQPIKDEQQSNHEIIERVYERYRPLLNQHFRRFGADAEDLTQKVYMRLMSYSDLSEVRDPKSYVRLVASRVLRTESPQFTHRARVLKCVDPTNLELLLAESGLPPPLDDTSTAIDADQLWQRVTTLPENEQQVLLLRHRDGLTYQQIVATTGFKIDAVKKYLKRAKRRLFECFSEMSGSK